MNPRQTTKMAGTSSNDICTRLLEFILLSFPIARTKKIGDADPLFTLGVLDSMGILEVLMFVQSEFGVTVDTADLVLENFGSVQAMAKYVAARLAV